MNSYNSLLSKVIIVNHIFNNIEYIIVTFILLRIFNFSY